MNQKTLYYTVRRTSGKEEHLETAMKVLFVLDGTLRIHYQDADYDLHKEDILLLNPGIVWDSAAVSDSVLYAEASYESSYLAATLKSSFIMFYCNSVVDSSHSYQDLRDLFYQLTAEYTARTRRSDLLMDCLLLGILDTLVEHYQVDPQAPGDAESETDYRMREIMQYIIANLDKEINLTDLADSMYVSTSTLSRIFRKSTGVYFADYVMQMRVRLSLTLLSGSEQNLTQVALSCGFANSATFSRAFRKYMDMTPTEYREQHRVEAAREQEAEQQQTEQIRGELKELGFEQREHERADRLDLDLETIQERPFNKCLNRVINIGAFYDLTRANIQFHVSYLQDQLHYEYIRVWNVFSERMQFTNGTRGGTYYFGLIDQALDYLVQRRLRPVLVFDKREDVAIRSQGDRVFYKEDYIQFVDKVAWQNAVTEFLRHILMRYGAEEVSTWLYEMAYNVYVPGDEGPHLYDGPYSYIDTYEYMYRELRRLIPGAHIGQTSANINTVWRQQNAFARACIDRDIVPDYMGWMLFPYEDIAAQDALYSRVMSQTESAEEHQVALMQQLMQETGLAERGVKLYAMEWNNSISNRNYLNDSCYRAAYIVHKIERIWDKVDGAALMCGSDWISSYMDSVGILNGGIGLVTRDTIRKPAFYAVEFLNQLGNRFLTSGDHYIVTRSKSGSLYILCYYYSWFRREHFLEGEDLDIDRYRMLHYQEEQPIHLEMDIRGLQSTGTYVIKRRMLNAEHGSILDAWETFGYETRLSRNDVKYLEAVSTPAMRQSTITIREPQEPIHLELTLQPQELSLLHIYYRE